MSQSLAFVFPGQGSQAIAMLAELAQQHDIIQATFAEASEVLGYDLWDLVQTGPVETLNQTDKTQPSLLASSVALWRLWQAEGGAKPALMAGHSLGEYSALVCAGAIKFTDAINLVKLRGEFMQAAVPTGTGAMAAILGLADDAVEAVCAEVAGDEVVSAVNYNCPGQVVIAGAANAVKRALVACKEAGAKRAIPLPVSVPSHCALMKPAADKMVAELAKIEVQLPEIPVLQNVDAKVANTVEVLKSNLLAQLYSPVLWTQTVKKMVAEGVETLVECGPNKVLAGLNKKIHKPLNTISINMPENFEQALS